MELNKETNAKCLAIFDFATPSIDLVRLLTGMEPTTGEKITTSGRFIAASFIIIPSVKVTKIEKFAKLARDNKAFKFTYEGYDDVFHLSKTEHVGKLKGEANMEMIRWHEKTNLPLFSWSSQAGGFFSGRYTENDKTDTEMVEVYYSDANWERYKRAKELAQKKACTPIQISLAYVLTQSFPTAAVIGPENETELKSSVAAAGIHLSQSEVDWLDLKA